MVTGFVIGLWLLMMTVSGILINHQEQFGLLEMEISNQYLPDHYTDEFHPETTRLNVVLTDLHSGRFFGESGRLLADAVGLLLLVSIGSGVYSYFLNKRLRAKANGTVRIAATSSARSKSARRAPETSASSAAPETSDEMEREVRVSGKV